MPQTTIKLNRKPFKDRSYKTFNDFPKIVDFLTKFSIKMHLHGRIYRHIMFKCSGTSEILNRKKPLKCH